MISKDNRVLDLESCYREVVQCFYLLELPQETRCRELNRLSLIEEKEICYLVFLYHYMSEVSYYFIGGKVDRNNIVEYTRSIFDSDLYYTSFLKSFIGSYEIQHPVSGYEAFYKIVHRMLKAIMDYNGSGDSNCEAAIISLIRCISMLCQKTDPVYAMNNLRYFLEDVDCVYYFVNEPKERLVVFHSSVECR